MNERGNAWTGRIRSDSYNTGGGPHHIAVTWTEREALRAERVEFEGLKLTPTRYHEDEKHGIVAVNLQATLSPEEVTRLRELQERARDPQQRYWYVTRVGVSAQPRTMRFGRLLWNKRDDESLDYQIVLVDAARDEHAQDFTGLLRLRSRS